MKCGCQGGLTRPDPCVNLDLTASTTPRTRIGLPKGHRGNSCAHPQPNLCTSAPWHMRALSKSDLQFADKETEVLSTSATVIQLCLWHSGDCSLTDPWLALNRYPALYLSLDLRACWRPWRRSRDCAECHSCPAHLHWRHR